MHVYRPATYRRAGGTVVWVQVVEEDGGARLGSHNQASKPASRCTFEVGHCIFVGQREGLIPANTGLSECSFKALPRQLAPQPPIATALVTAATCFPCIRKPGLAAARRVVR